MISVQNVIVDPYHKQLGALAHVVSLKLAEDAKKLGDEDGFSVINTFARLWAQDPTVLVVASLDTKTGKLVGYAVASIEGNQAFLLQPRFEEPTDTDATGDLLSIVEQWVKGYNETMGAKVVLKLVLVTRRFDTKWTKKYGFGNPRYLMEKQLD